MERVADLLVILAAGLVVVARVPQVLRLVRTRDVAGVSLTSPVIGAVSGCAWVGYSAAVELWPAIPARVLMVLVNALLASLVAAVGRMWWVALPAGCLWAGVLGGVSGFGGTVLLGSVLAGAYLVQTTPAVWVVYRASGPSGVAPATWLLAGAETLLWGGYGLIHSDLAYTSLGVVGVGASLAVLLRVLVAGRHPGQDGVDPLYQSRFGLGTDYAANGDPAPDQGQGRDAASVETGRGVRVVVDVHLDHLDPAGVPDGEPLEHGGDQPAGCAPGCPEVDEDELGGVQHGVEVAVSGVDEPRQRGVAGGALGAPGC